MKSFYSPGSVAVAGEQPAPVGGSFIDTRARVAIYDGPLSAPRVEEVAPGSAGEYIENLSSRVYELARQQGGTIPYTVVREIAENLIHASFAEPVVSVLDSGNTIRFADQGPGISDKSRAVLPGFTTASGAMKEHIRGVGSGLPIVKDYLAASGGELVIEDNLGCGAVVTIAGKAPSVVQPTMTNPPVAPSYTVGPQQTLEFSGAPAAQGPGLTTRQKQVLALVMESGAAGPSLVSRELGVGISTAYRDLASLEEMGLITSESGKRALTDQGMSYLDDLITGVGFEPSLEQK